MLPFASPGLSLDFARLGTASLDFKPAYQSPPDGALHVLESSTPRVITISNHCMLQFMSASH